MAFGRIARINIDERCAIIDLDDPPDERHPQALARKEDFLANHWQTLIVTPVHELSYLQVEFDLRTRETRAPRAQNITILPRQ